MIVFNFKGNQDLPEEMLKRMEREQLLEPQKSTQLHNHSSSKPLLSQPHRGSNPNILGGGVFSPKRNSVNV